MIHYSVLFVKPFLKRCDCLHETRRAACSIYHNLWSVPRVMLFLESFRGRRTSPKRSRRPSRTCPAHRSAAIRPRQSRRSAHEGKAPGDGVGAAHQLSCQGFAPRTSVDIRNEIPRRTRALVCYADRTNLISPVPRAYWREILPLIPNRGVIKRPSGSTHRRITHPHVRQVPRCDTAYCNGGLGRLGMASLSGSRCFAYAPFFDLLLPWRRTKSWSTCSCCDLSSAVISLCALFGSTRNSAPAMPSASSLHSSTEIIVSLVPATTSVGASTRSR